MKKIKPTLMAALLLFLCLTPSFAADDDERELLGTLEPTLEGTTEATAENRVGTTLVIFGDNTTETGDAAGTAPTFPPTVASATATPTKAPAFPPSAGHAAYNFSHIYLIGGVCEEMDKFSWSVNADGEDEFTAPGVVDFAWNARFFAAGLEAFGYDFQDPSKNTVVRRYCSEKDGNDAVTRQFHLDGLAKMEEEVGEENLKNTLVITLGENLNSDWTLVADLLRKGLAFFHGGYTGESVTMNLTEYDLSPDNVMYFYFRLEFQAAATRAGVELCRLKGGDQQIKVGKLLWSNRPDVEPRVNVQLKAFKEACPDTDVIEVWTIDFQDYLDNGDSVYRTNLRFKELPDVGLTFYDAAAKGLLEVAEEELQPDEYARFATTGWDDMYPDLLKQKKILTTVDQMVFYPNRGHWNAARNIVLLMQETGLRTTRAVQEALNIGDTVEIVSSTHTVSADTTGYLLESMMRGYNKNALPTEPVDVSAGLRDVSITDMIPFEGRFEAVLWIKLTWIDQRLAWNPFVHPGELRMDPEEIWTPPLFFKNELDSEELYSTPAIVNNQGLVMLERNLHATFLCPTTEKLRGFPFDRYDCSISLMAPDDILLDAKHGFEVIHSDAHFHTETKIAEGDEEEGNSQGADTVHFRLKFTRRPFTGYVRLIIPAVVINLVGFMAFWIAESQESIALGVTALLCSLAFRETVEMPDTAFVTWTEMFMIVNISYQASVMLIIWAAYGSASVAWCLNRLCVCLHPKKMEKATAKLKETKLPEGFLKSLTGGSNQKLSMNEIKELNNDIPANDMMPANDMVTSNDDMIHSNDNVRNEIDIDDFAGARGFDDEEIAVPKESAEALHSSSLHSSYSSFPRAVRFGGLTNHSNHRAYGQPTVTGTPVERPSLSSTSVRQRKSKLASKMAKSARHLLNIPDSYEDEGKDLNTSVSMVYNDVDWIGRWLIVPSYIFVMGTLIGTGWGFYDEE